MRHVFIGLFAVLMYTAAMTYQPADGYTKAQARAMDKLIERSIKPVWRTKKAEQLAEVYGISPGELDDATKIWGKP